MIEKKPFLGKTAMALQKRCFTFSTDCSDPQWQIKWCCDRGGRMGQGFCKAPETAHMKTGRH
jgi:hypothetical protein